GAGVSQRLPSVARPRRSFPRPTTTGRPLPFCERASHPPTRHASCASSRSCNANISRPTTRRVSPTASLSHSSGGHPMRKLRRPTGGLWSHSDFLKLWTGQTISEFGWQVSGLAIPWLAAVSLHATPFEFSILGVLGFLPFMLFALPAGVWVDRLRRRPILIAGDAARAVLLAYIPVAWAIGILDIWQLMALQFVIGIFTVFFDIAYQSYQPSLVDREQLVEGNSKLQTTVAAGGIGGPGLAGVLIGVLTAPYAIALDAVSFLVSTAFMLPIRAPETLPERREGEPKPKMLPELKEGLLYVVRHRHLKWIAMCTGTSNFFGQIGFSILILYIARKLHISSFWVRSGFAWLCVLSLT